MQRFLQAAFVTLVSSVVFLSAQVRAPSTPSTELRRFYVFSAFVDDTNQWGDFILDVKPSANGTVVQYIRIAPLNYLCTRPVTVKAVERTVPVSSVAAVAQIPLCSLKERDVRSAIKGAKPNSVGGFVLESSTIVATCGAKERIFDLPFGAYSVDPELLQKQSPTIAPLWDLSADVRKRAFGEDLSLSGVTAAQDAAFQELGSKLVTDMKAGLYDKIFARDSLLSALLRDDYVGIVSLEEQEAKSGFCPSR